MIRAGLAYNDYVRLDGIRISELIHMRRSPAHFRFNAICGRKDTSAFRVGRALHTMVLEPELFAERYSLLDDGEKATGEEDGECLKRSKYDLCVAMADSLASNPDCQSYMAGRGVNEFVAQWTDEATGLRCKQRNDRLVQNGEGPVLIDLKTASDASRGAFARAIERYGYHVKAGFYLRGLRTLGSIVQRYALIVVENSPPHCSVAYELTQEAMRQGEAEAGDLLVRYAKCIESDAYPGYESGYIDLPRWAQRREIYW